jgi:hypothetical protein
MMPLEPEFPGGRWVNYGGPQVIPVRLPMLAAALLTLRAAALSDGARGAR